MRQYRLWLRGGAAWLCLLQVHSWDEGWDLHVYAENLHGCHWETFKIVLQSHKNRILLAHQKGHRGQTIILGLQKCETLCLMKGFPKLTCHQWNRSRFIWTPKKVKFIPPQHWRVQNQLSKMRPMYARESYDTFVFVMHAMEQWNSIMIFLG